MWNIVANRDKAYGVRAFVCDTTADLEDLPLKGCAQGSTAFIIENSKTYMLNGSKEWTAVTVSASGSSTDSKPTAGDSDYTIVDGGSAAG